MLRIVLILLAMAVAVGLSPVRAQEPATTGNAFIKGCPGDSLQDLNEICQGYLLGLIVGYIGALEQAKGALFARSLDGLSQQAEEEGWSVSRQARHYVGQDFCPPEGVVSRQYADVFLQFLRDHPERRHLTVLVLFYEAFQHAFPCQS